MRIPFEALDWAEDGPGVRAREVEVEGSRWAVVEYAVEASRTDWCEDGHRGFVLRGEIEYEFDDGREPLKALEGEAFFLPSASTGAGAHRGRNPGLGPARIFLIDDPVEA